MKKRQAPVFNSGESNSDSDDIVDGGDYYDNYDQLINGSADEATVNKNSNSADSSESSEDGIPEEADEELEPGEPGETSESDDRDDDLQVDLKSVSKYNKEIVIVQQQNQRTSHILSHYETTELIGIRGTQISLYNNCLVDITGLTDPVDMARREFMMRMCPLKLNRTVGERDGIEYVEVWSPNEMTHITTFPDVI